MVPQARCSRSLDRLQLRRYEQGRSLLTRLPSESTRLPSGSTTAGRPVVNKCWTWDCVLRIDKHFMIQYHKNTLMQKGGILLATRSVEDRIAVIDGKIEKKKAEIEALEAQKQNLLHPVTMKAVMAKAKEAGMSAKEIAEKLGLEV